MKTVIKYFDEDKHLIELELDSKLEVIYEKNIVFFMDNNGVVFSVNIEYFHSSLHKDK